MPVASTASQELKASPGWSRVSSATSAIALVLRTRALEVHDGVELEGIELEQTGEDNTARLTVLKSSSGRPYRRGRSDRARVDLREQRSALIGLWRPDEHFVAPFLRHELLNRRFLDALRRQGVAERVEVGRFGEQHDHLGAAGEVDAVSQSAVQHDRDDARQNDERRQHRGRTAIPEKIDFGLTEKDASDTQRFTPLRSSTRRTGRGRRTAR